MNVSLTPALERFVRRKVASGLYNNASEVIREALRLLLEHEPEPVAQKAKQSSPSKEKILTQLRALEQPLRERGLTSLAIFGSFARGEARPNSDVDVLVDIAPDVRFSLVDLVAVKDFLEDRLRRPVDLVTKNGLEPLVKERVSREAETVF